MPELKKTEVKHYKVDYGDWDDFVQEVYGNSRYEIVADEEANNDSCLEFTIKKEELHKYDADKLAKFKNGEYVSYMTRTLMTDLCNQGLIPEGKYLIKISW